jgi:HPt (histidine-containing phosphotransfer) domain-containing protein
MVRVHAHADSHSESEPLPADRGTADRGAGEQAAEPALSATMLRDLLRLGDTFFAQLVDNFLREGPRRIERLRRLAGNGELGELATTAHGLASVAGTVAAVPLTELCHQLEKLARDGAAGPSAAALTGVERGFEAAAAELRRVVAAPPLAARSG